MTAKNSTVKKGTSVVYQGTEYPSVSALCFAFNIERSTVAYRLRAGSTIEEAMDPRRKRRIWTKQECIDISAKYETTRDFRRDHSAALIACEKNGWMDLLYCENVPKPMRWTKSNCIALSLVVESTMRYRQDHKSAWSACVSNGWIDLLQCENVGVRKYHPVGYWNKERVQAEALKYTHLKDMERGNRAAYNAAKRMGITQEINAHMIWQLRSDHDTLYILRTDQQIEGLTVYKCGVTSWRLGTGRFKVLGAASGFKYTPLFHKRINGNAIPTEQAILSIGRKPLYGAFDGSTEHRQWTDGELERAMTLAHNAAMQFNDVKRDEPKPLTEQISLWG